jgi:hypothetical protein
LPSNLHFAVSCQIWLIVSSRDSKYTVAFIRSRFSCALQQQSGWICAYLISHALHVDKKSHTHRHNGLSYFSPGKTKKSETRSMDNHSYSQWFQNIFSREVIPNWFNSLKNYALKHFFWTNIAISKLQGCEVHMLKELENLLQRKNLFFVKV